MAGLAEQALWADAVYQIETNDPVVGGPPDLALSQGIANVPHQNLANRTAWLKQQLEELENDLQGYVPAARTVNAGGGLSRSGSDDLSGDITLSCHFADASEARNGTSRSVAMNPDRTRYMIEYLDLDATTLNGEDHEFYRTPVGAVTMFLGATPPPYTLALDGTSYSTESYADLYALVGNNYGPPAPAGFFNLPDLRGQFPRGWDNGRGSDPGRGLGTSQGDAMRDIIGWHTSVDNPLTSGAFYRSGSHSGDFSNPGGSTSPRIVFDASRVVPTAHEFRPRNTALNFCIRY